MTVPVLSSPRHTTLLAVRADAYLVSLADGVEVVTGRGTTFLSGHATRVWIERLLPALDGTRSLDQIVEGMSAQRREVAERIIGRLVRLGAVVPMNQVSGGTDDAMTSDVHASEVRFLGQFLAEPAAEFERYRGRSVVVSGPAELVTEFVDRLRMTGLSDIRTVADPTDRGKGSAQPASDADVAIQIVNADDPGQDGVPDDEARAEWFVQLVLDGERMWWYPVSSGIRWSDIRARLRGLDPERPQPFERPTAPHRVPSVAVTVATNSVVHDIFRFLNGVDDPAGHPVAIELNAASLMRHAHPIRPHPFNRPANVDGDETFLARLRQLAEAPRRDESTFSAAAVTLMDSSVGVFAEMTQSALPQIPLKVTSTVVADPVGLLGDRNRMPTLIQADLDFAQCRRRLGMRAIGTYASLMLDPRRTVGSERGHAATAVADPWQAVAELRRGREAMLHGLDLLSGSVRFVRVADVFPALLPSTAPYGASTGLGIGLSWTAALEDALAQHCARMSVSLATRRGGTFHRVDLIDPPTESTARVLALLRALRREPEVSDISSDGVPALVCALDGVPVAISCAPSYVEALEACVLEALRVVQGYPTAAPPALPHRVAAGPWRSLPTQPRMNVSDLVSFLVAHGVRPLAVPLDHDPQVAEVLPNIVRVVLHER